jgi:hypothetical protein
MWNRQCPFRFEKSPAIESKHLHLHCENRWNRSEVSTVPQDSISRPIASMSTWRYRWLAKIPGLF